MNQTKLALAAAVFVLASSTAVRADQTNLVDPASITNQPHQLRTLTSQERDAKLQEWREKRAAATNHGALKGPIQTRLEQLRRKKAEHSITPQEQRELDL